jgi:hypothetical protein
MSNDEALRYPIGRNEHKDVYTAAEISTLIDRVEALPATIEKLFTSLSPAKIETPYRPGGWTARQVLHHIPDSHLNAYIRTKWTLTEETPTIKAYDEAAWAQTGEIATDPALAVALLKSLHAKWVPLLRSLREPELKRSFYHPESKKHIRLDQVIATYAWHGDHHAGHLKIVAALP